MPDKLYLILHSLGAAEHGRYHTESPSLQGTFFSAGHLEKNFPLGDFRTLCFIFDELIASLSVVLTPSTQERRLGPWIGGCIAAGWAGQAADICPALPPRESKQSQSQVGPMGSGRKRRQVYLTGQGAWTTQSPVKVFVVSKMCQQRAVTTGVALYCVSKTIGFSSTYRFIKHAIYLHLLSLILPPTGYLQY